MKRVAAIVCVLLILTMPVLAADKPMTEYTGQRILDELRELREIRRLLENELKETKNELREIRRLLRKAAAAAVPGLRSREVITSWGRVHNVVLR